jgi:hypothetical protein
LYYLQVNLTNISLHAVRAFYLYVLSSGGGWILQRVL